MYTHDVATVIALHSAPITTVPLMVGKAPAPVTFTGIIAAQWAAAAATTRNGPCR